MRIVYFSQVFFSDCDFPLIRELQQKGINIKYIMPLRPHLLRGGLVEIKNMKSQLGFYKASDFPEMEIYKEYLNMDNIYFLNLPAGVCKMKYYSFWLFVYFRLFFFFPKVFHYTWQLHGIEKILYYLPFSKVMTVHDPLSHSCINSPIEEEERKLSFRKANAFVLLSKTQVKDFCRKYFIHKPVFFSRLGEYSHMSFLNKCDHNTNKKKLVVFFGQIVSHKGIELLCEAFVSIHKKFPEVNLLIAGNGKMYFNFSPYEKLEYIHLRNEFVPVKELSKILNSAMFGVCPYRDATQSGVVQTAFSCKLPLIVTNVGNLSLAVKNEITGLVIPPNDVNALVDAIDRLLSNPSLLSTFRKNIESVWLPEMGWKKIADDYINVWKEKYDS